MIDKEKSNLKNKKTKKILLVAIIALVVSIILISGSMAYYKRVVDGNKKYVITASSVTLVLDETSNDITIDNTLPQTDEDGMTNSAYTFSIENMGSTTYQYTIYLEDNEIEDGATRVSDEFIKYYLTNDSLTTQKDPALLSSLSTDENGRILETGTIAGGTKYNYTLRFWVDYDATQTDAAGKAFSVKLNIIANQGEEKKEVTFGGITKEVNETMDAMFNYTNEGKYISDYDAWEEVTDTNYVTNGIYAMEDDDAVSYFYRGEVDNLVKFGSYTKDYYVYRYDSYDFASLEACQYYNSSCSESDKVVKYAASDNVPMYWRIVRINGDGTIRMIYAGTTPDATGYDTGIGVSRYNEEYDDPKYTGYTYDRTTNEVNSDAKAEIDTWYANVFEGTTYDNKIATGKFCSDSSDYGEVTDFWGDTYNAFGAPKRLLPSYYNLEGNVSPTFKCAATSETYGGSYNLKAGLIMSDEIVAAGGNLASNNSYYLYNGTKGNSDGKWFWSLSPDGFYNGYARVGCVDNVGSFYHYGVSNYRGLLRPVINLKADITFKSGTDGSTLAPYEIN